MVTKLRYSNFRHLNMNTFTYIKKIPDKTIVRKLSSNSNILIKEGDTVTPSDILAETKPSAGFHIVNITTALGVKPEHARQYVTRKEGEKIYKGEILAEKAKMFSKETIKVATPIDGIIQQINEKNGQVLLKMIRKQEYIPAGVWGKILKINEKNEVEIQTQVLEISGKIGRGFERAGSIKLIASPNETIHEYMLKEEYSGRIIVGGALITREAIAKCVNLGVSGIVCGGIEFKDILAINESSDIGVSIVILEGFGTLSINNDVFTTLTKCDNFYSFINGKEQKLIIPLETLEDSEPAPLSILSVGSKVRVLFDVNIGQTGEVKELISEYIFPSGIKADALRISTLNKEQIVPAKNVEILT